ncbi:MAG: LPXTG cell wall anchor domain-containing protein [Alphaproteobacteria bacterium]|nr:LPXTG cell wall anchor domain-containing protein [Alphaproteobacteria bacterium]
MRKTTIFSLLAICGSHLFCCVLPAVLAIFGIFSTGVADFFHGWMGIALLVFGGLALIASFLIYMKKREEISIWLVVAATALYAFSLMMYFSHSH